MEQPAMRLYQCAYYGCALSGSPQRMAWNNYAEATLDGRVVGRYLASRNPWGEKEFHMEGGNFNEFYALQPDGSTAPSHKKKEQGVTADQLAIERAEAAANMTTAAPEGNASKTDDATSKKAVDLTNNDGADVATMDSVGVRFTAASVHERWRSVEQVITDSGVLNAEENPAYRREHVMEVYTGQMCFLRNMFLEERYPPTEEELRARGMVDTIPEHYGKRHTVASRNMNVETCDAIFGLMQKLKRKMDLEIHNNNSGSSGSSSTSTKHSKSGKGKKGKNEKEVNVAMDTPTTEETSITDIPATTEATQFVMEPDLECWESMLLVTKHMLDFLLTRRSQESEASRQVVDELFSRVAEFRHTLLRESKEKYNGRFKLLWLQEF